MTLFEDREHAFENRHARDEDLRFKALARRNRALGLWAAGALGLDSAAAAAYARELASRQVEQADDERLARELADAFASAKIEMSTHRISRKMEETMAAAVNELSRGK
jgi:hypothetical protein